MLKTLEIKQLREEGIRVLHHVGEIECNINGTLEDLREEIANKSFLRREKLLFLTSKLEAINPRKERDVTVRRIFKKAIRIKILHGTGVSM